METNLNNLRVDDNGRITLSGVGSGIDTEGTIDTIMKAKRIPVDRLEKTITDNEAKITAFKDLKTLYSNFQSSLDLLRGRITFDKKSNVFENKTAFATTAVSGSSLYRPNPRVASDAQNLLNVTVDNRADTGLRSIEILQTAKAHKISSGVQGASTTTPLGLSGSFVINGGTINITAGQSLVDVRDAINNATFINGDGEAESIGVQASIITASETETYLILTADDTGETMSIEDPSGIMRSLGFLNASGASRTGTAVADPLVALNVAGTINIEGNNVSILATDTLTDIAAKIDALAGVDASVNGSNQLVITDTSGDGNLSFADPDDILSGLGITQNTLFADELQAAAKAQYSLDGITDPTRSQSDLVYAANATLQTLTSGTVADGSFDVTIGATTHTIAYDVDVDDLNSLVSKINTAFGSSVASVQSFGSAGVKLIIDGGASNVTVSNDTNGAAGIVPALNFRNTRIFENNSNNFSINSVNYTLFEAEPGTIVNLAIENDRNAVAEEIQKFVEDYNAIIQFFEDQDGVIDEETGETVAGPLFQDSALRDLKLKLSLAISSNVSGASAGLNTLAQAGIKFRENQVSEDGTTSTFGGLYLEIDEEKFLNAINNNFDDLQKLFTFSATTNNANFTILDFDGDMASAPPGGLQINFTTDASGNITAADVGGDSTGIEISGKLITFTSGPYKGLKLSYSGGDVGTQTVTVNYSNGFASQLFADVKRVTESTTGVIDQEVEKYEELNDTNQERVDNLLLRLELERQRLVNQFLLMETTMAELDSVRQSVTQAFEALSNSQGS